MTNLYCQSIFICFITYSKSLNLLRWSYYYELSNNAHSIESNYSESFSQENLFKQSGAVNTESNLKKTAEVVIIQPNALA